MFLFAFPGMGKTTLAQKYRNVVDLELSDIKYDNSSVSHLTKEERKATKRPIKDRNYRQTYIDKALAFEQEGKVVLLALNFLLRMLWTLLVSGLATVHLVIPHPSLRAEYRSRYIQRGNNATFIWQVMTIWYPVLVPLYLLSKCLPNQITVAGSGETLEDHYLILNAHKHPERTRMKQKLS